MKIVLINPRSKNPREIQQKCFAPISLLYLASSLIANGYTVDIIDANALALTDEEAAQKIKSIEPDLIGVALFSEIIFQTYALVERIKKIYPQGKFVLGGAHVNASAQNALEEFKQADFALRGESEESIVLLCRAIENKMKFSDVAGLYYRQDDKIIGNRPAEPIRDLDSLRPPARGLIEDLYKDKKFYLVLASYRPVETIVTSRGCPFGCRFCCNTAQEYRVRSTDNVLAEILSIYRRGIKNIDIADANFTFDRDRAMRIFDLIKKERFNISFRIKSRPDSIDKELVKKAKGAGVYLISLGMESGSQKILNSMAKGTTIEKNVTACQVVMRQGVKLNTGWIIGCSSETEETVKQTVNLILKIKPTTANIGLLIPYPGTQFYEEARINKTLVGDWSIREAAFPWIKLPWVDSYADLQNLVRWVKNKVYYRPYYLFNFAKEIIGNANVTLARYALQESGKSFFKKKGRSNEAQTYGMK